MNWAQKKVLVTGAEGFIGSHLTERLVALGAEVKALVMYNSFNTWGWIDTFRPGEKNKMHIICADIREADLLKSTLKDIDIVFHLAALIAIPYSYASPSSYVKTNIEGTLNLLQTALDSGVEKFIHTSTSEVYGTAKYVPIDEKHPLQGQSPYSASKIGADMIAESFHKSFELPVTTVRPFNTYGPRQSARAIIPTLIVQMLKSDKIQLGSLHPVRDFTYVTDTAEGFIKAAEADEINGKVINLGSANGISIGELAEKMMKMLGKEVAIECEEKRVRPPKSELNKLICNNQKAKEMIGWQPKVSLDEGLEKTINWFKENLKEYKSELYTI
jgi:NAD dependent epimerase/dehydratase